jgi:hypothetical protein
MIHRTTPARAKDATEANMQHREKVQNEQTVNLPGPSSGPGQQSPFQDPSAVAKANINLACRR